MKLLVEQYENLKYLKEDVGPNRDYYISGKFAQGNLVNKNGRIYPTDTLAEQVKSYNKNYIAQKRSFSELGHPDNPTVNLDRVSHIITELTQDGDDFNGKAKVLDTPSGKIVKVFMDEGCQLAVSTRALGSLKESYQEGKEVKIVQPDLILSAIDIVSDPSGPECFVENLRESPEWILDESTKQWVPKFRDKILKPAMKNMRGMKAEDVAKTLFENFMSNIGKKH